MSEDYIDYATLIDDAMHIIVKKALEKVGSQGLQGEHHFFVSFLTQYPGVVVPKLLQEKYPDEITIVLQHQFENLRVFDDRFAVSLSFNHVKEEIVVPLQALTSFADPSVKFGLQFKQQYEFDDNGDADEEFLEVQGANDSVEKTTPKKKSPPKKVTKKSGKRPLSGIDNVVSMEHFRKTKKDD